VCVPFAVFGEDDILLEDEVLLLLELQDQAHVLVHQRGVLLSQNDVLSHQLHVFCHDSIVCTDHNPHR
jgi:hypothetical protein